MAKKQPKKNRYPKNTQTKKNEYPKEKKHYYAFGNLVGEY